MRQLVTVVSRSPGIVQLVRHSTRHRTGYLYSEPLRPETALMLIWSGGLTVAAPCRKPRKMAFERSIGLRGLYDMCKPAAVVVSGMTIMAKDWQRAAEEYDLAGGD